jgi:dCTP deaminase
MILTRHEIEKLISTGKLNFSPALDKFQNQPHAVDLRLGMDFYLPKIWEITENGRSIIKVDVTEKAGDNYEKITLKAGQWFELAPGESIIASTLETIQIDESNIMGVLYPRSSINRRGLSVDMTGIVDAYYHGKLMIPIVNKTNAQIIRIYPGERICQLVFERLETGLNQQEALFHGKFPAKYHQQSNQNLTSKQDFSEELDYIKAGKITEMKDDNPF